MNIQRGNMVEYVREPGVPVKVISDPFQYNGMDCVVGIRIGSKKKRQAKAVLRSTRVEEDRE